MVTLIVILVALISAGFFFGSLLQLYRQGKVDLVSTPKNELGKGYSFAIGKLRDASGLTYVIGLLAMGLLHFVWNIMSNWRYADIVAMDMQVIDFFVKILLIVAGVKILLTWADRWQVLQNMHKEIVNLKEKNHVEFLVAKQKQYLLDPSKIPDPDNDKEDTVS